MFSDFPNLHPLVVHFPIVLILLSAALQGLLIFKDSQQLRWGTLIIMGAAFVSAVVSSKIFHAHITELPPLANQIYQDHERYSDYTLWISGLTFLFRGIGEFYQIQRRSYEGLVLASALVAAVFLSLTGHRGAQLVYLEGVGPQGNLVTREGQEHGATAEMNHPMPMAAPDVAGHQAQHGGGSPGQKAKPIGQDGDDVSTMDHASAQGGHSMPGMDHATSHHPAGPEMDRQGSDQMPGMKHPPSPKPRSGQAHILESAGMNHPMPSNKTKAKRMENMAGMDHSQMNTAKDKEPALDHEAMGHGSTPAPGNQPIRSNMRGMSGMDVKTDINGRPLIDPTAPYDNNPARQQGQHRPPKQ